MNKKTNFKHISMYKGPEESPGYLLWQVSTRWRSLIQKALAPFNLTHPQFVVLASLAWLTQNGEIVSQIDVAHMAGLDPNTTSQVIRSLVAKKFVKRSQRVDERSKNPIVTDSGADVLSQAISAVENVDGDFFKRLSKKDTEFLINLFQQLMS